MSNDRELVRFCPRCFSKQIRRVTQDMAANAFGAQATFYCKSCNLTLPAFPEETKAEIAEIKKEAPAESAMDIVEEQYTDESQPITVEYANYLLGFWWKIIGPFGIILSLMLFTNTIYSSFVDVIPPIVVFILSAGITLLAYKKKKNQA